MAPAAISTRLRLAKAALFLFTADVHAALNGARMADPVGWITNGCLALTAFLLAGSVWKAPPSV